jgi:phosphodiesterase/alkaline phosphatase D-like protein
MIQHNNSQLCTLLIVFVLICLGICQTQAGITRGPYLSFAHNPSNSMMVSWGTDSLMTGVVEFGSDTLYFNTAAETSPDTIHHVELTGLLESTHYYYRVVCGIDTLYGDLWTAPTSSESFEIIAYGDSRSYPNNHLRVVKRYMQ